MARKRRKRDKLNAEDKSFLASVGAPPGEMKPVLAWVCQGVLILFGGISALGALSASQADAILFSGVVATAFFGVVYGIQKRTSWAYLALRVVVVLLALSSIFGLFGEPAVKPNEQSGAFVGGAMSAAMLTILATSVLFSGTLRRHLSR